MNKEPITFALHDSMVKRASRKIEAGQTDFAAYPVLGMLAVAVTVGIGEKSDQFYTQVNKAIVEKKPSQVYAIETDHGNGYTTGRTHVRADLAPIEARTGDNLVVRAVSPRTQSK